jgi:hypothetical protein
MYWKNIRNIRGERLKKGGGEIKCELGRGVKGWREGGEIERG